MSEKILLAHGSGGRMSRDLIESEILSRFGDGPLKGLPDAAYIRAESSDLVFSTDSFVVQPLVFPGGNIGDLAVHGTVNDLAVSGAVPSWLSLGLILEEGLEIETLRLVLDTIKKAADYCAVQVVTGDTKVVHHGQCDGLYINTSGIGEKIQSLNLSPSRIEEGDVIIVNGSLGDHGMAVMMARESLELVHGPLSDTAPVHKLVQSIADLGPAIRVMRDPTRGGASAVLNELVNGGALDVVLDESKLPFSQASRAVAEILGTDLLQVASEGRLVAVCSHSAAEAVLRRWQSQEEGRGSRIIGHVTKGRGRVILETLAGGRRIVDVPEGEILPRIC